MTSGRLFDVMMSDVDVKTTIFGINVLDRSRIDYFLMKKIQIFENKIDNNNKKTYSNLLSKEKYARKRIYNGC